MISLVRGNRRALLGKLRVKERGWRDENLREQVGWAECRKRVGDRTEKRGVMEKMSSWGGYIRVREKSSTYISLFSMYFLLIWRKWIYSLSDHLLIRYLLTSTVLNAMKQMAKCFICLTKLQCRSETRNIDLEAEVACYVFFWLLP